MLRSFRARLIITYLLLIVLPIGLLGWIMLQALNQIYVTRLQDDMSVEAGLIAASVANDVGAGNAISARTLSADQPPTLQAQARVLVFDRNGRLMSPADRASADAFGGPASEPGLADALAGRPARGVELSPAANTLVAYVAQPISYHNAVVGAIHLAYSLTQIQQAQRDLQLLIVAVMSAGALVATEFGARLTQSITRPLARFGAAAARIANGDLSHRVPEEAPSEVAVLARSFNRMAEALQQSERARQESFAKIAHDVRTPLGAMRAGAEALAAGAVDQPDLRDRLLTGLIEQSRYLGRLTDDLLRLAAYEGGGLVLRPGRVALAALVDKAARGFEARAAARSVRIDCAVPDGLPDVRADADRVLEALFNLLDNALAHTPAGGRIQLRANGDAAHGVWLHVVDSGPGIPKDMLPDPFDGRRPSSGRGRFETDSHLGLGLSIVREIVRAHGGVIAACNAPTGGADIAFRLPSADLATSSRAARLA